MKLKISTHISVCKTSKRTKGFCAAMLRHGDIRDLVVRTFVQSIMNFVSPARNEAIPREILWYIPLHYKQQHARLLCRSLYTLISYLLDFFCTRFPLVSLVIMEEGLCTSS